MIKTRRLLIYFLVLLLSLACSLLAAPETFPESGGTTESAPGAPQIDQATATSPGQEAAPAPGAVLPNSTALIQPGDFEYLGAFRLPDGPAEYGWSYSGAALAYYAGGDPTGPDDGFPGSLFGTGHDWNQYISEISIPIPVLSPGKNLADLNTATTLQEFQNIRGGFYDQLDFELPRAGLAYLPPQGEQTSDKLYFCWHQHMGEMDVHPTHGWSELDLSNPQPAGPWRVGDFPNYVTCDYLFDIPQTWADNYTHGMSLATGRFRDGGQGSMGPTLFAIGPWIQGNPPAQGSILEAIPLLLYSSITSGENHTLNAYHHSDEWTGAAWLTAGDKSAVIFAGVKGQGKNWYGCSDGTVWPDEPPYPPECPERGWWSSSFQRQIIFYDPADLAAVAQGLKQPWEPQPYAVLDIDPILFDVSEHIIFYDVGAASFDRQRGLFYLFEPLADEDKSIVHVWRVIP